MYSKYIKGFFLLALVLLACISVASATDTTDDATSDVVETPSVTTQQVESNSISEVQTNDSTEKTLKNLKQETKSNHILQSESDFDNLFTGPNSNNVYELTSSVSNGDDITFNTDISKTGKTYLINKEVNIIGNDKTITLNTVSGSHFENETGFSFIFDHGAAHSTVTNLNFYNTQVIVRNTTDIVFDNIDQIVSDQNIGQGIGVFSIRADSSYITVENSRFSTTNNGGSSTLVLASANHCTINNNNITGIVNITKNSIVTNNNFTSKVKIQGYTNFTKNIVESTLTVTGNYSNVTNNTITKVIINGDYNNVTNNILSFDIINNGNNNIVSPNTVLEEDLLLNTNDKSLKSEGEPSIIELTLDNLENFARYDEDVGAYLFRAGKIRPYDIICFAENMKNKTFILGTNDERKIFTAKPGVTFTNSWFSLAGAMNKVIENITFDIWVTDGESHTYFLVNGVNNTFRNLKISYEELGLSKSYLIKVQYQNDFVMDNCTVESSVCANAVDWGLNTDHPGLPSVIPFYILGNNNTLINNNFSTEASHTSEAYPSLFNLYLQGDNNLLEGNTISVNGQRWMYNIVLGSSSGGNHIKNNNINTNSTNYSAGIYLMGVNICDNVIEGNIINTTAGYAKERDDASGSPEFVSYGVIIENRQYMGGNHVHGDGNVVANNVINNTFLGSAFNIYSLEIFGADDSLVENNTVKIFGNTTMGLGAIGCNTTFNNNNITVDGQMEYGSTVDYLGAGTTGILILRSDNSTATNNTINSTFYGISSYLSNYSLIDGNNIISTFDYTVNTNDANNNNITNNFLIAKEFKGDDSVKDFNSIGTLIENNLPKEVKEYSLIVDTTEFTPGQTATIQASINYGTESSHEVATNISKGKMSFKVNGKTLKDANGKVIYAKVVNGVATIENYQIPYTWNDKTVIQAVYSGSTDVAKMSSEKTTITITSTEATITTEDVTATVGATVTLKATINTNATVNSGKVVFKINGKTVKDANGKVFYSKVSNNQVTLQYVLPEEYKVGMYNITAVFVSPNYDRLEDTKTLTITEA